jgi:hypothetical protein
MMNELNARLIINIHFSDSPGCSCVPIVTAQLLAHTIPEESKIYVSFFQHLMVHTPRDVENHLAEPAEICNW